MMLLAAFYITILVVTMGMPYRVPLQGRAGGFRTLVLLDDMTLKNTHSVFFEDLLHRGHTLTFYESDFSLKAFGDYLYDNIVLFTPKYDDFATISSEELRDFIDDGGNLMFIANGDINDKMRLFAATCGVEFDKKGSVVVDHFKFDAALDETKQHSVFATDRYVASSAILGDLGVAEQKTPVLYSGVG